MKSYYLGFITHLLNIIVIIKANFSKLLIYPSISHNINNSTTMLKLAFNVIKFKNSKN
jgi:hypothetical protein